MRQDVPMMERRRLHASGCLPGRIGGIVMGAAPRLRAGAIPGHHRCSIDRIGSVAGRPQVRIHPALITTTRPSPRNPRHETPTRSRVPEVSGSEVARDRPADAQPAPAAILNVAATAASGKDSFARLLRRQIATFRHFGNRHRTFRNRPPTLRERKLRHFGNVSSAQRERRRRRNEAKSTTSSTLRAR